MTDWYVIQTAPQRELAAAEALRDRGFTVYCPTSRKRVGRKHVLFALFPRYLFCRYWIPRRDETDDIRDKLGRRMITGSLTVCGRHEPIPEAVIGKIAEAAARRQLEEAMPPRELQEGDLCIISSGPGEGKIGRITKLKKGDAAFEIIDAARSVTVKLRNLKLKEAA